MKEIKMVIGNVEYTITNDEKLQERINEILIKNGIQDEDEKFFKNPPLATNNLRFDVNRASAYLEKANGFLERDDLEWCASEIEYYVIPKLENMVKSLRFDKENRKREKREHDERISYKATQLVECDEVEDWVEYDKIVESIFKYEENVINYLGENYPIITEDDRQDFISTIKAMSRDSI